MMKTRVFITDGRGMVGRNLIKAVLASNSDAPAPSWAELNLPDPAADSNYAAMRWSDVTIHAATKVVRIQGNIARPASFLAENIRFGLNVMGARARYPRATKVNLPRGDPTKAQTKLDRTHETASYGTRSKDGAGRTFKRDAPIALGGKP